MKTYNVFYAKSIVKKIQADNYKDAAYIAALHLPENSFISNIEEIKTIEKNSELLDHFNKVFNPNKK